MTEKQVVDITAIIDNRKMDWFTLKLVSFGFLMIVFDGYDMLCMGFIAPFLVKAWGVQNVVGLSWVFSAAIFGILFGAPIFGFLGDKYGRVKAIATACLIMGVFSMACMWAASVPELVVYRFIIGIGIGGMLPNIFAINSEFSPKHIRETVMLLMSVGISAGGVLPGLVVVGLVPLYGWKVLFFIGGAIPLIMCAAVLLWMPESIKYLVLRDDRQAQVRKVLATLRPDVSLAADATFVTGEKAVGKVSPKLLFAGHLKIITPLLWLMFIFCQMSYLFVNAWLPMALTAAKMAMSDAAMASSIFQIGGVTGVLFLTMPFKRSVSTGVKAIAIMFLLAIPLICSIGYAVAYGALFLVVVFVSGFLLLGLQAGIMAVVPSVYPTAIRSSGAGWAFGIARFGAISGAIIPGFLLAAHFTLQQFFLSVSIPLALGTIASAFLVKQYYRHENWESRQ